ncbi:MarR family transcriptional regulator [Variovorax dokdonensis]|uniref:MarR family transcriptional regulator n=1 Tax=Variovorax dokdonensis TaxID=344883 RepID=A0ABT7N8P1_9BURK|nr:MarR family transcriptional regulator [Variovorax dokdonensis]MDM0044310.1 MarR family transcriptional regulator [Variovorax dokdonensis]
MNIQSRLDRLLAGPPAEIVDAVAASRALFRVSHLLQERIDAELSDFGIDMREYLALVLIADDASEPLRPSVLSSALDATRTQVTRLLDGMERKGLARRLPGSQDDRRSLHLVLTQSGRQTLERVTPSVHAACLSGWAGLGAGQTTQTLALLRIMLKWLTPAATPPDLSMAR